MIVYIHTYWTGALPDARHLRYAPPPRFDVIHQAIKPPHYTPHTFIHTHIHIYAYIIYKHNRPLIHTKSHNHTHSIPIPSYTIPSTLKIINFLHFALFSWLRIIFTITHKITPSRIINTTWPPSFTPNIITTPNHHITYHKRSKYPIFHISHFFHFSRTISIITHTIPQLCTINICQLPPFTPNHHHKPHPNT